jgi:hypothetical protein
MARNKVRCGRVTPKGTRPGHLRPVGDARPDGSPIDYIIDEGGRELLDDNDPISAEMWASAVLDVLECARSQAQRDGMEVPDFEEALLMRCRQRRDLPAAAVAAALDAVVPPIHESLASLVAAELRGIVARAPGWLRTVGAVTPTRGWIASDVFGDQGSLIIGFRQDGEPGEHALVVLVDYNLSGQVKDAWLGPDAEEVVASWRSNMDPHMRIQTAPLDQVLGQLRDAMAMSDLWNGDPELRTEDFASHRALIWARLRRAGLTDVRPIGVEVGQAERDILVSEFMASEEGRRLSKQRAAVDIELLAHYLVDLRADYEGRPLRWSPFVVSSLLGDLAPRKLLLDSDEASAFPDVVRAYVRFSADRAGLGRTFVDEILVGVDEMEPEFLDRIGDPSAAGPAKAVLTALRAQGVDLTDVDAINEALERDLSPTLLQPAQKRSSRAADAPADVAASAEHTEVLARFGILTSFYGKGRKLTQTGRPTLADAKELVTRLGTKDRVDETIGDRPFKTKSAAELPELAFMIRWAVSAGALRKEHGKLRATAAWLKLEGQPLQQWMKAADALTSLGPLAGFRADNRYSDPDEFLEELAPEILGMLRGRPMPYDEVLDWVCERADVAYEWLAPYMQDPSHRRTSFEWDLDLLWQILAWAGIAERVDATVEPDRFDHERLVGGTLQLTLIGRWWLGNGT